MEKNIARFLKYGTLLSTYGLIATVLLQIFARFFLQNAPALSLIHNLTLPTKRIV